MADVTAIEGFVDNPTAIDQFRGRSGGGPAAPLHDRLAQRNTTFFNALQCRFERNVSLSNIGNESSSCLSSLRMSAFSG